MHESIIFFIKTLRSEKPMKLKRAEKKLIKAANYIVNFHLAYCEDQEDPFRMDFMSEKGEEVWEGKLRLELIKIVK